MKNSNAYPAKIFSCCEITKVCYEKTQNLITKEQLHRLQQFYSAMKENTTVIYYNGVHYRNVCLIILSSKIQTKEKNIILSPDAKG